MLSIFVVSQFEIKKKKTCTVNNHHQTHPKTFVTILYIHSHLNAIQTARRHVVLRSAAQPAAFAGRRQRNGRPCGHRRTILQQFRTDAGAHHARRSGHSDDMPIRRHRCGHGAATLANRVVQRRRRRIGCHRRIVQQMMRIVVRIVYGTLADAAARTDVAMTAIQRTSAGFR